mmetsp:Transcript_2379/g.5484  ORF Transcript_2379/g.5484 Transcript_2379/m.5484 type:complete len:106 (+) Transcript_2379:81-398(+)
MRILRCASRSVCSALLAETKQEVKQKRLHRSAQQAVAQAGSACDAKRPPDFFPLQHRRYTVQVDGPRPMMLTTPRMKGSHATFIPHAASSALPVGHPASQFSALP